MLKNFTLQPFNSAYGQESNDYRYDTLEELQDRGSGGTNWAQGFAPLESLPATWYNTIMYLLTKQAKETYNMVSSIYEEIKSVITSRGDELDDSSTTQLLSIISTMATPLAATSTELGSIKIGFSSTANNRALLLNSEDKAYVNIPDATTGHAGLMTASQVTKLNGIETNANNYSLPTAGSGTLGGIRTGYSESGRYYAVQVDGNGRAYVYVPWSDTDTHKTWYLSLSGNTLSISDSSGSSSVTLPSADHVTSATYLRPSGSSSTAVTADSSGNLTAHTLTLS